MSAHDGWLRATPDMLAALYDATTLAGLNPWDYRSSTVGALKKLGWVKVRTKEARTRQVPTVPRRYDITDAGRKALEQDGRYLKEQAR